MVKVFSNNRYFWNQGLGQVCRSSVLPWENQPDSFCNLSDRSDQKSTGLNSEQNNRPVRWWFHLIIKCWQKMIAMKRMLSVACLERKKMRAPAQFWAGFEKTPRGDIRKHKATAKSANAVHNVLHSVLHTAFQLVSGLKKDPPTTQCFLSQF